MPLGIESTDAWLRNLAPLVGKEQQVERLIAEEHERIKPTLASLRSKLAGKRVFVSAGQARAMTMSALATELGFELVGTTVYHYDEVIVESIARLSRSLGNFPINVANVQPFEQANLLHRLKPDLYLSDEMTTGWAAKQGIPTMMIYDYGMTYLGYEGVLKIGERVLHAISNPSFSLGLQRHKSLPYRESWYSADPFKYVAVDGVE
jgi:nitrogenase molybdenum-iron protein alpha chain